MDSSISTTQIHFRGIPSNEEDEDCPGSILEHESTSMKVRVLDCHILEASQNEAKYCLFEASADLINKTRERFFFRCRKELGDKIKIREPAKVRLLIPKSSLESRTNILVTVWPKVFICEDCGLVLKPTADEIHQMISTKTFKECTCARGNFRQTPHILQCRICGSIRHIPDRCCEPGCGARVHLKKASETDIDTWRLICDKGHVKDFKDYLEIYYCDGSDNLMDRALHDQISEGRRITRKIMTTVGRGIFSPLIMRFPTGERNVNAGDALLGETQRILVASNCHMLDLKEYRKIQKMQRMSRPGGVLYEKIRVQMEEEGEDSAPESVNARIQELPANGDPKSSLTNGKLKALEPISQYRIRDCDFSKEIQNDVKEVMLSRCDDWNTILSGYVAAESDPHSLSSLMDLMTTPELEAIKERFGFVQIKYLERISIVTGTYGAVRGSIVPIFNGNKIEPVRVPLNVACGKDSNGRTIFARNDARGLPVIVTKKETEGIAFILRIKPMVESIQDKEPDLWNEAMKGVNASDFSEEEARAWLLYAYHSPGSCVKIAGHVLKIVHSISHLLIRRLSQVGGLRESDVGEMLFPEFGGILIYNGLENPLGMMKRIFLEGLPMLINEDLIAEASDCDMDPLCSNQEEGAACHACLHVPEHVCEKFNVDLDRNVLIGEKGYWQ